MKKFRITLFCALLLCSIGGCQRVSDGTTLASHSYSVGNSEFTKSMTSGQIFPCGDDYLIAKEGFLYYVDSETLDTVIACNDVTCSHTDSDCGAFLYSGASVYGEYIYFINDGTDSNAVLPVSLYREKIGGGEIEEVMPLMDAHTDGFGLAIMDADTPYLCYNDSIVYIYRDTDIYNNKLGASLDAALPVLSYDGPTSKIEFEGVDDEPEWSISGIGTVWNLWQDGDDIYIEGTLPTEASQEYYMQGEDIGEEFASMGEFASSAGYDTYKQTFYRFNQETKQVEKVWVCPDASDVGTWDTASVSVNGWYLTDGILFYFLSGNGVWKTNLYTGKTEKTIDLSETETRGTATFDDDYVYIDVTSQNGEAKQVYAIYRLDGNLVAELEQRSFLRPEDFSVDVEFASIGTSWDIEVLGSDQTNVFIHAKGETELRTEDDLVHSEIYHWIYCLKKSNLTAPPQLLSFDKGGK